MHHLGITPTDVPPECNPYAPCACRSCQPLYSAPQIPTFPMQASFPSEYPIPEGPAPVPQMGLHPRISVSSLPQLQVPVYQTNVLSPYTDAPALIHSTWKFSRPIALSPLVSSPQVFSPAYSYSSPQSAIPPGINFSAASPPTSITISMAEEGSSSAQVPKVEQEKVDMKTAQELADLEKLSAQYEPDVSGALVGKLQSSKILQAEYADADPVYVQKTAALSPKYSNYRTIRGDGNCGWRALAYGYFELLLRTGDAKFIQKELERIDGLSALMVSVGMSDYLFDDFVDETKNLLKSIGQSPAIDDPYDDKVLVNAFNNDEVSNAIITHLKLLTSAFMKVYPDAYEAFLIDYNSIDEYRSSQIEPYGVQIDHLGVKALVDVLFIPAGLSVEISYLDRSESDEVNVHKFEDESTPASAKDTEAQEQKILRLLYRPGHYDLIYKNGDLAPSNIPASSPKAIQPEVRVSMMLGETYDIHPFLEKLKLNTPDHASSGLRTYRSHDGRVSTLQKIGGDGRDESDSALQTKMFRNSHYNTRHYQNEHFQPEMWHPYLDEPHPKPNRRRYRKQSQ